MKKLLIAALSIGLCMSLFIININSSNAKLAKKKWCSGLKVSKIGIYSLGCDLAFDKPHYPLRGKNWVYSGDTFGFIAENVMKNIFAQYDIRIQILVVKGIATKVKPDYYVTENGTFNHKSLDFDSRVYGINDSWNVWDGKIYVKSKKGCTIQIKFSQKVTASNKWNSFFIKVNVRKKP